MERTYGWSMAVGSIGEYLRARRQLGAHRMNHPQAEELKLGSTPEERSSLLSSIAASQGSAHPSRRTASAER
jgi:hypothetical protein